MSINKDKIHHTALSARIALSEEEADTYTNHLNSVLGWIEKLNEIDVQTIEPTYHILPVSNVFRKDEVTRSLDLKKTLENAPDTKESFFSVPKIV